MYFAKLNALHHRRIFSERHKSAVIFALVYFADPTRSQIATFEYMEKLRVVRISVQVAPMTPYNPFEIAVQNYIKFRHLYHSNFTLNKFSVYIFQKLTIKSVNF